MDASQVKGDNNAIVWVLCSFVAFGVTNYCLGFVVPGNVRKTGKVWKWKNISSSFLHSCISGIWAMLCFWQIPAMREDLINNFSVSGQGAVSLSVGYFLYDLVDMAIYDRKHSADLLIHHLLVILCLGLSVCTCYYQGYALVALLVEVNSIFLHSRQLMLLHGIQKSTRVYKTNGVLNLVTFVIFRVFTMGGMFSWLLAHRSELSGTVVSLGVISLIVIMGMNFQLLYRVVKSDYLKKPRTVETTVNSSPQSRIFPDSEHLVAQNGKPSLPIVANGKPVKHD